MKLSVIHRLRHGHWYEPEFVPISDYLEWRVCGVCRAARGRVDHQRTLAAQADALVGGRGVPNFTQIFAPFPSSESRAREPEAVSPLKEKAS